MNAVAPVSTTVPGGLQESELKALSTPCRTARRTVEYTKPTTNDNGANTRPIRSDIFSVPTVRNSTIEPRSDSGSPGVKTHARRNRKARTTEVRDPQAAAASHGAGTGRQLRPCYSFGDSFTSPGGQQAAGLHQQDGAGHGVDEEINGG